MFFKASGLGWPLTYLIFSVVLDELWWIEIMILTSLSASLFADYYAFPPVHLYSRLLALAAVKRLEGASFFVRPLVGWKIARIYETVTDRFQIKQQVFEVF